MMTKSIVRLRRSRATTRSDQGFSLIELMVSMSIFAVLLAVMMKVIVSMNGDLNKTRSIADAAAQGQRAIEALDKQLRYADWVNDQASGATDKYISFEGLMYNASTSVYQSECYQWRLHTGGTLQQRSWDQTVLPTSSVTATNPTWTTVATGVVNTAATPPFTHVALPDTTIGTTLIPGYDQVDVDFVMQGSGSAVGHAETKLVITARNSNYPPGSAQCNAVTP